MGNTFSFSSVGIAVGVVVSFFMGVTIWRTFHWRPRITEFSVRTTPVKGVLRVINFAHDYLKANFGITLVKRNHAACMKLAQEVADSADSSLFGPQDKYLELVRLFTRPEYLEKKFTPSASGTIFFNTFSLDQINMRKMAMDYIQQHREKIENARLVNPFIITGLPRTGSTMLHNLLACDPTSRTTYYYEMSPMGQAIPPVKSKEQRSTDERIASTFEKFNEIEKVFPGLFTEACKSHRTHPNEIEEDILLLFQNFMMLIHGSLEEEYLECFINQEKEWAYTYHRLFLQMMNEAWSPESHWVLKCPGHSLFLDSVQEQFPDARFIFTHRDPVSVVPSITRLAEGFLHWLFVDGSMCSKWLGDNVSSILELMVERIREFRDKNDESVYFDIGYEEFVKDPIDMVKQLYSHFGKEVTEEFEEAMKQWIAENRQGKYGRRGYTLEQYGFTEETIKERYPDYPGCFSNKS